MIDIIFELIWYFLFIPLSAGVRNRTYAAVKHKKFMNRVFKRTALSCIWHRHGADPCLLQFSEGEFLFLALGCSLWLPWWNSLREALMERYSRCKW